MHTLNIYTYLFVKEVFARFTLKHIHTIQKKTITDVSIPWCLDKIDVLLEINRMSFPGFHLDPSEVVLIFGNVPI